MHDPGQVTGTLTGPCRYRDGGQLPDPRCTPGAYDPAITAAVLCSGSYSTRSYRPPVYQTSRFKYESAYPAYGVASGTPTELDHLVSLELGGSNDASNLWPESPPVPNPKDAVENALHTAVCAGRVSLAAAQRAIARNWITAEKVLGISTATGNSGRPERAVPPPSPDTSAVRVPPPSSHAAARGCYPKTNGGNCYRAGEFCRKSDHGLSGVSGSGTAIRCVLSGSRWRWE